MLSSADSMRVVLWYVAMSVLHITARNSESRLISHVGLGKQDLPHKGEAALFVFNESTATRKIL
jgi:hypothetical protein